MLVGDFSTEPRLHGKRAVSGDWHITLKTNVELCDLIVYGFDEIFSTSWCIYWEYPLGEAAFKVKGLQWNPGSYYPGIIYLHDYINTSDVGLLTWDDLRQMALESPEGFFNNYLHFSYNTV